MSLSGLQRGAGARIPARRSSPAQLRPSSEASEKAGRQLVGAALEVPGETLHWPALAAARLDTDGRPSATRRRSGGRALPPLRWVAEEDLVYDTASETLHRAGCPRVGATARTARLAAGEILELVWAPTVCECRPDVTLQLG